MRRVCDHCGQSLEIAAPGDHVCPQCEYVAHVDAEGFDWETGIHLGDGIPPEDDAPTAPLAGDDIPIAPAGQICEVCVSNPATRACPACHRLVCETCIRPHPTSGVVCALCAGEVGVDFDTVTSATFFTKFFPAIAQIALHPGDFFSRMSVPGRLWPAVIFGLIVAFPGGVMEQVTSLFFQGNLVNLMAEFNINLPEDVAGSFQTGMQVGSVVGAIVFLPVALLAGVFINGAITHLMLMILGGANAKIEDTIRVVGYGNVSALAKLVPGLGTLISYVWNIVVVSIGLSRVHRIPGWKAVTAILAPQVFCCCVAAALAAAIAVAFGAMDFSS